MLDYSVLKGPLERLVSGTSGLEDRELVWGALESGALALATGERAAAVGGSADDAFIVTGDGNIFLSLQPGEWAVLGTAYLSDRRYGHTQALFHRHGMT